MDVPGQHLARAALEQALDESQRSQDRLRLVTDTIPGLVWSGLPDGSFDFVNRPVLTYFGCIAMTGAMATCSLMRTGELSGAAKANHSALVNNAPPNADSAARPNE